MNEEIKKQSAELNEAALENVSGGTSYLACIYLAEQICRDCTRACAKAAEKVSELATYMQKGSNFSNIHNYKDCPIYNQ